MPSFQRLAHSVQRIGKKVVIKFVLTSFFLYAINLTLLPNAFALSEECSSSKVAFGLLDKCIIEIQNEVGQLKPAHEKNQQELSSLKKQISNLQAQIKNLSARANALALDIDEREKDLAVQEELLQERVRSFYIRSREFSPILIFLSSGSVAELARELALRGQAASD